MQNYRQVLHAALRESEQSGRRVKKLLSRKEFMRQFPKAASDPRMALLPERFIMDITPLEAITVGQLRKMCLAKKDHPLAIEKALSVQGLGDDQVVHLLREDLDVLQSKVIVSTAPENDDKGNANADIQG